MSTPLVLVNNFQPEIYTLDLQVSLQKSNFNGQLVIELVKDSKPIPDGNDFVFSLNSSELVILKAVFNTESDSKTAKVNYDRANELVKLIVEDGKSLYNESNLTLSIKYIGKINAIKTFRDFTRGVFKTNYLDDRTNTATNYVIATHCQASFARSIFPSIDEPVSKSQFKLSIETDSRFKVLSNTLPETQEINDLTQKISFNKTPLMNTSIFGFIIGDLDFIESKVTLKNKTIPLRLFTTIGNISGAAYALDIAQKTLPFIESQFNVDYPLDKLDFVALPFLSDGAMENFGLVTIQSNHILIESLNDKEKNQSIRQLIVHEIIHHWIGNNISFDEWNHLWLNESFATWFAYYILFKLELDPLDSNIWEVQSDREFKTLIDSNSAVNSTPVVNGRNNKLIRSTQDAFQVNSYQKGIQFLRMLSNVFEANDFNDELSKFTEVLSKFIVENQFKSIKPSDLWKNLNKNTNLDILTFSQSWLRLPGFPILNVNINEENQIEVTQHRFIYNSNVEIENLEDVPYHVPLLIKLIDGSVVNLILTDRKLVLKDIEVEEFIKLNSNRIGFYLTNYNDSKLIDNIILNINKLSTIDLINIISDLSEIIGHDHHQTNNSILSLIKISNAISNEKPNFLVLNHLLQELRVIQDSFKLFVENSKYKKFEDWLTSLNLKIYSKLDWDIENYSKLSVAELESRKSILTIGLNTPEISNTSINLFKHLIHGPSNSIPVEWLEPSLAATSLTASTTTWKKILELAKQPGATVDHVFRGTSPDIQHAALSAIGYTKDQALVKRVLNFVKDNVDYKLIELGLVGLQNNHKLNSESLWNWFKLNYNNWVSKTLRPGSEKSENLKKTINGISIVVFSWMNSDEEIEIVDEFVKDKLKTLPKHDLEANVKLSRESQSEKKKISESFDFIYENM